MNNIRETIPTTQHSFSDLLNKPIEIYVFIDPLCPECWSLEPIIKKLMIEYGQYFTIRPIISGNLTSINAHSNQKTAELAKGWNLTLQNSQSCKEIKWPEDSICAPWMTALAIKAAELQGRKAGMKFLRKVQEALFIGKQNISSEEVFFSCASKVHLDMGEFKQDIHSDTAKRALQCDLTLTHEMDIDQTPAIVLFNQRQDEEGIKITGSYPYSIYVEVLHAMLQKKPTAAQKPSLVDFLQHHEFVGTKEIAEIYDWTETKAICEMKKLLLKQQVEQHAAKHDTFWRYTGC
ncbi:hypothetical protein N784_13950 [Pontibacillus litoralis JSM 072002]|uniref:ClpXP adapter protein SpxH n=2 Tax=Pontibacillus TaxID=289201 RepID=A0A0A5G3M0_9BACI|nr:hypothetical protein N784_13950 [Pontibacillus litoralis JSM 072002]